MGGKVQQTNPAQATAADAGATSEAKALDAQATKNLAWQQAAMSNMFGSQGADGKLSGGSMTPMTDPSKLSTTGPQGPYQLMYKQQVGDISKNAADARTSERANMANRGFATGSGMEGANDVQLALGEGAAKGQAYSDAWGAQHNEDLSNFWNANNLMSGNAATMGSQGIQGLSSSAQTYNNLYGTAGQGQMVPGMGAAIAQGLGVMGGSAIGAFCPAEGARILLPDAKWAAVETLREGSPVLGIDGEPDELIEDPRPVVQDCVEIVGVRHRTRVGTGHTFQRSKGGYAFAARAAGETLLAEDGSEEVCALVNLAEKLVCFRLMLKRSHGYCVDGFWSLE